MKLMPHAVPVEQDFACSAGMQRKKRIQAPSQTAHHKAPAVFLLWERAFNTLHTHSAAGYTSTNRPTLSTPSRLFHTDSKMGLIAFINKLYIYQYNPKHHQRGLNLGFHKVLWTESAAHSSWDPGITQAKEQDIWIILNDIKTELILSKSTNPISGKLNRLNIFGLWHNSRNLTEHEVQQLSHRQRMEIPFLPSKSLLHTQKREDGKIYSSLSQFPMGDHY